MAALALFKHRVEPVQFDHFGECAAGGDQAVVLADGEPQQFQILLQFGVVELNQVLFLSRGPGR